MARPDQLDDDHPADGASAPLRPRPSLAAAFARHGGEVHALARRLLVDPATAEDVTCRLFVWLSTQPKTLDATPDRLRSVLLSVCHRCCVEHIRSDGVTGWPVAEDGELDTEPASARSLADGRVVGLAYFGHSTYDDVAELVGATGEAVKVGVRRGLQDLRGELVDGGG